MDTNYIIKKLLSGSAFQVGFLVIAICVAFFLMPFIVHNLGDRYYGLWVLAGSLAGYNGFLDFGLATAVARFISKEHGQNNTKGMLTVSNSALAAYMLIGTGALLISIIVGFSSQLFMTDPVEANTFTAAIIILGISVALQFPVRSFGGIIASFIRQDLNVYADFIALVLRTSLVVWVLMAGHGIIALAFVTLGVNICSYLLQFYFMKRIFPEYTVKREYMKWSMVKNLYGYSWVAFISNFSNIMTMKLSPFVVAGTVGVNYVVFYAVAFRLLEHLEQAIKTVVNMTMPVFSRFDGQSNVQGLVIGFKYTMMISVIVLLYICISLVAYGEKFITIWMGPDYVQSYHIMVVLCLAYFAFLVQAPAKSLLFGMSKQVYNARIHATELVLSLSLSAAMGYTYGLMGIAAGLTIGIIIPELFVRGCVSKVIPLQGFYRGELVSVFLKTAFFLVVFTTMTYGLVEYSYTSLFIWNVFQVMLFIPWLFLVVLPDDLKDVLLKRSGLAGKFALFQSKAKNNLT